MASSSSNPGESQQPPQAGANVLITGGTFLQVDGGYHHNPQSFHYAIQHEIGLHALNQAISHSAMHDSSERDPPPRCHPDTRKAIINEIMQWIQDPAPSFDVYWLHGTVGVGKSAILQMIADLLREMDRRFGGAFFFGRGKAGRDKSDYLIPTIAYQLATLIPELRNPIDQAMRQDPALPKKNLETQMRALIILPCQRVPAGVLSSHTPTVIIDGLDECSEHSKQVAILSTIAEALKAPRIPLRFLIASRPESHIAEFFQSTSFNYHGLFIPTDTEEVDEDMRKVFVAGFEDIRVRPANIPFRSSLLETWPGNKVVQILVRKACGQFVYADTVLKFVGAEFYSPNEQLKILLQLPLTSCTSAFARLDQLYTHILSSFPRQQTLKDILTVLCSSIGETETCASAIEDLFGLEKGEVQLALRGLRSVVQVVSRSQKEYHSHSQEEDIEESLTDLIAEFYPQDLYLNFYHASFSEFLLDQMRSKQFHISQDDAKVEVVCSAFQLVLSVMDTEARYEPRLRSKPREVEETDTLTRITRHDPRPVTWNFLSSGRFFKEVYVLLHPYNKPASKMCTYRSWIRRLRQSLESQAGLEPSPHRFRALITIFVELRGSLQSAYNYSPECEADMEVVDSILHISRTILNKWLIQELTTRPLIRANPLSLVVSTFNCSVGEWSWICQIDSKQVLEFLKRHTHCVIAWLEDDPCTFFIPLADFLCEELLPSNIRTTLQIQWIELCCSSISLGCVRDDCNGELAAEVTYDFFETPSVSDVRYIEGTQAYGPLQSLLLLLVNIDWSWSSCQVASSAHPTSSEGLVWPLLKWLHRQAEYSKLSPISQQTKYYIFAIMDNIFCGQFLSTQLSTGKHCGHIKQDDFNSFQYSMSQNILVIYSSLCDFLADGTRNQHAHEAIPTYHTRLLEYLLHAFVMLDRNPESRRDSAVVHREYEVYRYGFRRQPPSAWKQFWPVIHWKWHFGQVMKSENIENRLVEIHHICTVSRPHGEGLPSTWAEGVLEYLERMPGTDPGGSLESWCNELKDRRGQLHNDV